LADGNLTAPFIDAKSTRRETMLDVGTQAPDFKVKDHRGQDVSLADLRGKTVVLWFYPKADTPG
jgi:peroxiredoxin